MRIFTRRKSPQEQAPRTAPARPVGRVRRGQSAVEFALVIPIVVLLLSVVVEAGIAFNAWIRVQTAARDGARFIVDNGTVTDTSKLVLEKLPGLEFGEGRNVTGSLQLNIYVVTGTTGPLGTITVWNTSHPFGGRPSPNPIVQRSAIQTRLQSQGLSNAKNVPFVLVEVDFNYRPVMGSLLIKNFILPMTSYTLIQKY